MSKYLNKFAAEGTITRNNIGNLNLWFVDDDIEQLNFPEDYFLVQEKFISYVIDCTEKLVYNLIKNWINSKAKTDKIITEIILPAVPEIPDFEVQKMELKAVIQADMIRGVVVYVDNYGNATTNIRKSEFERIQKGRSFEILFGREDEKITEISSKYKDVSVPEKLALFGENNLLQIAINKGKASSLLGLKIHEVVRIEFK